MADMSPVTWEITGVTQETQYGLNAAPIPGKNVAFKVSNGYTGSVFIPDTVFKDQASVAQAIDGEVRAVVAAMAVHGSIQG